MLLALVPWFFVYPDFVNLARSSGCEDYVASGEIAVFQVWRRIAPGATQMPLSCWCDKYCMENGSTGRAGPCRITRRAYWSATITRSTSRWRVAPCTPRRLSATPLKCRDGKSRGTSSSIPRTRGVSIRRRLLRVDAGAAPTTTRSARFSKERRPPERGESWRDILGRRSRRSQRARRTPAGCAREARLPLPQLLFVDDRSIRSVCSRVTAARLARPTPG